MQAKKDSKNCLRKDYVVVGGGVAGLCCALRLAELGAEPLVIEAGSYPSHKICGEFLAPDSLSQLKKWNIHPVEIRKIHFHSFSKTLAFPLPQIAGGLSHFTLDPSLAQLAKKKGAEILTQVEIVSLQPGRPLHTLVLSTGEIIHASHLLIATGRIPSHALIPPQPSYLGIKAHFSKISLKDTLEMFFFDKAYLGISPIENGSVNAACLAEIALADQWESPLAFLQHLISQNTLLSDYFSRGECLFSSWMIGKIPSFGMKKHPNWPAAYFLGDAVGTTPPVTGNGLSMAIQGGVMAADYAMKKDPEGFKRAWKDRFISPIYWGRLCHKAAMNLTMRRGLFKAGELFPSLFQKLFQWTR